MRKNILSEYKILMGEMEKIQKPGDLEDQHELELYRTVNNRIEDILSKSGNRVEKLETLICIFEAKSTSESYNTILSLAYVVVSFNVGLFTSVYSTGGNQQMFGWIPIVISMFATILFANAWQEHKKEQNRAFILNLLRFRYEEIKSKEMLGQKREYSEAYKKRNL